MTTIVPSESDSYVPYARRRNTPAQLHALIQLFELTPHPTRAQRQSLANEIGMELKSVTNWFQNKRQTSRRKVYLFNENNHPETHAPCSPRPHRHRRSKTALYRSKISLDHIATLSERPGLTLPRSPLTPRKSNLGRKHPSTPSDLWAHMLSSPAAPPPSPSLEEARLAVLSSGAKVLFPLDWACLIARQRKWVDEDVDGSSTHPMNRRLSEIGEGAADPKNAGHESNTVSPVWDLNRRDAPLSRRQATPQFGDVEAAITLLDFKGRS